MTGLDAGILERFRCPHCGASVELADGGLRCSGGHTVPIHDGYVDAVSKDADPAMQPTFDSFGYEWNAFSRVQPEEEAAWADYFRDVPLEELRGKVGLDAGCGKGRFSRLTAAHLAFLVALDGSDAVEAAVQNLRDLDNVLVVKADLRQAPFEPEAFDFVSCLGVLHHLPDPEDGFRAISRLLAPDGLMLLYVYSRPLGLGVRSVGLAASSLVRRVTVRLPHPVVRAVSAPIALALYMTVVVPGALGERYGRDRLSGLPLDTYRRRPVRMLWLDTFDRLSAPLEKRYVWPELEVWFRNSQFRVEAVRDEAGFFVLLRKLGDFKQPVGPAGGSMDGPRTLP